jgi:hypothetical protein
VQLDLQLAVGLLLEDMGGDAGPGLVFSGGVLAVGRPFRRSVEQLAFAAGLDQLQLMVGRTHAEEAREELLNPVRPLDDLVVGGQEQRIVGVEGGDGFGVGLLEGRVPGGVGSFDLAVGRGGRWQGSGERKREGRN